MKGDKIRYRSGYKYQLAELYIVLTDIKPDKDYRASFIELYKDGMLYIFTGYAWDGASGPTVDTNDSMRGSLVHDAGYQLIREYGMPESFRKEWDKEFWKILLEDEMDCERASTWYKMVRLFGNSSCEGDGGKPLKEAP